VHGVELADVSGLNLRLEDLNAATVSNLTAQQRVEPVPGFGQRNLERTSRFCWCFRAAPTICHRKSSNAETT
jgi:hypothetical protein